MISIYVMTHKKFNVWLPEYYIPLQVGATLNDDLGYQRDDDGENISDKNHNYCELTGLYWMWKHSKAGIVGLCHYRRYFSKRPFDRKLKGLLTEEDIEKRLRKKDIILPYPVIGRKSNGELYCAAHNKKDYELTRETIVEISPEYTDDFDSVMNRHTLCQCNMFVARKEVVDAYCKWLFSIYEEMEKHVDLSGYSDYQARMYGFMSERLLNVWVQHNRLKPSYAFFASTEVDYRVALNAKFREFFAPKHGK